MKALTVRLLGPGDEEALVRFLRPRAESSMFLLSNLRSGGLGDEGQPFQGVYAGAFRDGELVAAAAHYHVHDMVCVQAPAAAGEVVRAAVASSGRRVGGLSGPWDQVTAARDELGLGGARTAMCDRSDLFTLSLDALRVPEALVSGRVLGRRLTRGDLPLAAEWRVAYHLETLGGRPGPELAVECRRQVEDLLRREQAWVLTDGGRPVAFTAFNAVLPDLVQFGGVFTPPALRGRGYARAAVAASLLEARAAGVTGSVLFTEAGNERARRAYQALGYAITGEFGLILFQEAAG